MKKVVLEIIGFAIAIALVVGVIVVIAGNAHTTGNNAKTNYNKVDVSITNLGSAVTGN